MLDGSESDGLFDLVFTLFSLFWLLGWTLGVMLLLALFLGFTLGAETLQLEPGRLRLRIEILRLGAGVDFEARRITGLRWVSAQQEPDGVAETGQRRGSHLAFEYGGETVRVGSFLAQARGARIVDCINRLAMETAPEAPYPPSPQAHQPPDREPGRGRVDQQRPGRVSVDQAAAVIPLPDPDPASRASTLVLVLANLIPLAGVVLANWDIGDIMLLFWAESAIIGLFNLLKMWVVGRWSVLFLGPFFIAHFGGFMVGHLLFIYALFLSPPEGVDATAAQVVADFRQLWPALLGLLVSHAVSFRLNFLGRREYLSTDIRQQMSAPYRRIIVMHLTIIFGGFLSMAFSTPLLAMVLLVVLKIVVDVKAHAREHRTMDSRSSSRGA